MTMDEGARIYAPGGRLLEAGDRLASRASSRRSRQSPRRAPAARTPARRPARCSRSWTSAAGWSPRPIWRRTEPRWTRAGRDLPLGLPASHPRRAVRRSPRRSRACRRCAASTRRAAARARRALDGARAGAHTTNLVTVDADGNACVLTTSLGLGSGDFLPGLDLHLNSMLGEADLLVGAARARRADGEHDGADARVRRATGSRSPSARPAARGCAPRSSASRRRSSTTALEPQEAVDRPRAHPAGASSTRSRASATTRSRRWRPGLRVRRWPAIHHYFGGVSASAARRGADPRRSGLARFETA